MRNKLCLAVEVWGSVLGWSRVVPVLTNMVGVLAALLRPTHLLSSVESWVGSHCSEWWLFSIYQ